MNRMTTGPTFGRSTECDMGSNNLQNLGILVFVVAVVTTIVLITMGIHGHVPEWFKVAALIF